MNSLSVIDGVGFGAAGLVLATFCMRSMNTLRWVAIASNVANANSAPILYRNVMPSTSHWLTLALEGTQSNRAAIGAQVRLTAGGRTWLRLVNPGSSFLCSNDVRAHVGLGSAERVDRIEVRWPDGSAETFPGCEADKKVVLAKGTGATSK